jgi:prefoldin subunit 5
MNEQEIREIFSDEAYVSSLLALDTPEEVQASLAEKGIDLSETEITTLLDTIQNTQSDGELSEEALETVTGGLVNLILFGIMSLVFLGTGLGAAISSTARRRW